MTPKEILELIDGLRERGVHYFQGNGFTVQMEPNVPMPSMAFDAPDVKSEEPEKPYWKGYTQSELFPQ